MGAERTFTRVKAMLTRAERSGEPARMLEAVAEARRIFDVHGWPDWWARVDRLEDDALWAEARAAR